VPFLSWLGVPQKAAEYLPAPTHHPATVVSFTPEKGAVPENDGVSSHASTTSLSRAVAVF